VGWLGAAGGGESRGFAVKGSETVGKRVLWSCDICLGGRKWGRSFVRGKTEMRVLRYPTPGGAGGIVMGEGEKHTPLLG